jgi:outer membrane protein assembly factor BamB
MRMTPLGIFLLFATLLHASDWPRFRGPNGTGVSPDRGLPAEIGRNKNVLWSAKLPAGNSSPVIAGGRVFLTGHQGDDRFVLCYSAATGEQLWRKSFLKAREETFHPLNGPATPSPATDGQRVFVFFPDSGLAAYDLDGKEIWQTPLGPFAAIQGLAASPIYVEGRVVLLVDTPEEAYLSAFDAVSGAQVWRTERPVGILGSYSTPALYAREGAPAQIIVAGAKELAGYQAATGERLWWANGVTMFPTGPPLVAGDSVYTIEPAGVTWPPFSEPLKSFDANKDGRIAITEAASDIIWARSLQSIDRNLGDSDGFVTADEYARSSSDESQGGGLARTRLGGGGDISASHVAWRHTKGMPSLTGALLYEDVLYVVRNAIISTFDPESGKLLRQERLRGALGDYYASPVAGDGKIYFASKEGKISVVRAGADWEVLSIGDLGEEVIATPAIADGRVYVRTEKALYCFGARG